MKKLVFATILFALVGIQLMAQIYVGHKKDEVVALIDKAMPDFSQAKVVNNTYNYLKYQDVSGEQTLLLFLDEKDVCTSIKFMSTYINLGDVIVDLNKKYQKAGEDKWEFTEKGVAYIVELQRGQWFFTVLTKKKI